jgi:uncharacterized membrane protein (UPF0182 family)
MALESAKPISAHCIRLSLGLPQLCVLAGLLLIAPLLVGWYTDWLWFDSLGYGPVYTTMLFTQLALFLVVVAVFGAGLVLNVKLAHRLAGRAGSPPVYDDGFWVDLLRVTQHSGDRADFLRVVNIAVLGAGAFFALVLGLAAATNWATVLRFVHARPFGAADPLFGQDVALYVFTLPLLRFLEGWLMAALLLVALVTLAVYAANLAGELGLDPAGLPDRVGRGARAHLLLLLAGFLLLLAAHHLLDLAELVHSTRSVTYGAGYTDVHAQRPAQWALCALALTAAALSVTTIFTRSYRPVLLGLGAWVVGAVVLGSLVPSAVQTFQVRPNELARQAPYIERNIAGTRQSYGLDHVEEQAFPAEEAVTAAEVRANPETINNLRLWDPRALLPTYNQLQSIRLYYDFADVDVDRYWVGDQYRQVMLGVRELVQSKLPPQAQTWVNERLMYTHGYGVTMNPVNAVGPEGQPQFFIKNVPPTGQIPVQRPEVYYGERERPGDYVVVRTATPEFDYPLGDDNAQATYQAQSGVELNPPWRRLLYALQFHDVNLLLNTDLRPDSQLLYRRNVRDRVATLASYLRLDADPYLVVTEGRLVWLLDAYTVSDRYPYAQPYPRAEPGQPLNYIRNSVKVAVDAYDGRTTFYVVDPTDPLVQTYAAIFPDLYAPLDAMPPDLRAHLRYPEDLFRIQAEMYLTYHMQNPTVFYNREDLWSVPFERFGDSRQAVEPYYTIMRLPEQPQEEFLLMLPVAPANRDNMIAWLAGRSDGANYGKLLVYKYPKDKLIYGPLQVETRIDQDPTISAQFTLWNQSGSRVIRGNLLVIPVGRSNLYLEPVYLQSEHGPLPELQRVVVATGARIAMEPTLDAALARLFGGEPAMPSAATAPDRAAGPAALSPTAAAAARAAREHFDQAREAQRTDDWARYGEELRALDAALRQLEELSR